MKGIEPSSKAWEAFVLPLNYTRKMRKSAFIFPEYGYFELFLFGRLQLSNDVSTMTVHKLKNHQTNMNAWLNLRQLLDTVSADTELKEIDERSQRLLEWIMSNYSPERPMFVQMIVMKSNVASPATIHKGLWILEREGLISVKVDQSDTRRRIVSPTERSRKLMAKLSQKVCAWAEELPR